MFQGCNILGSDTEAHYSIQGQLHKIERFYFINNDAVLYDTTALAHYEVQIDSLRLVTDSTGYFSKENLPEGSYQVRFHEPGFPTWDTTLTLQSSIHLPIFIQPIDSGYYQFKGTLQYLTNRTSPTPDGIASAQLNAGNVPIYFGKNWVRTNPDGSFHYRNIQRGSYRFGVYSNFFRFKDTTIELNQNVKYNPLMKTWQSSQPLSDTL